MNVGRQCAKIQTMNLPRVPRLNKWLGIYKMLEDAWHANAGFWSFRRRGASPESGVNSDEAGRVVLRAA